MGRQVKKTVIKYQKPIEKTFLSHQQELNGKKRLGNSKQERQRSRSREKIQKIPEQIKNEVNVDVNSRKARLQAMRKAKQQIQKEQAQSLRMQEQKHVNNTVKEIKIVLVGNQILNAQQKLEQEPSKILQNNKDHQISAHQQKIPLNKFNNYVKLQEKHHQTNSQHQIQQNQISQQSQDQQRPRVIHRPVFLSKQDRSQLHQSQQNQRQKQSERRKKNLRYTTKILLEETLRKDLAQDSEQEINNNDDQDQTDLPDDSDDKNQELEYELWKIRQLKRIRRDRQMRQKNLLQIAQIQRRRQLNNEQILLENRLLGSDSTDNDTETKYVFMQKYYHKGAFYQDSNDPIFQRDYNLPTPMEMQDKSGLPQVLQKRKGNFGKRGQSKYTHLTAEDTTDTNPLTRADESLLNSWKKKMAGYKN